MSGRVRVALLALVLAAPPDAARAGERSPEELAKAAVPGATRVESKARVLTAAELAGAAEAAGEAIERELWTQYRIYRDDDLLATAYFDSHIVRTLGETLLILVGGDGTLRRVEVVAFAEPPEYRPRPAWFRQFDGKPLGPELDLRRSIRGVTGATLSARSATRAVRRVLAVHQVLEAPPRRLPSGEAKR